ncbi:MAG: hypothetical protein ACFBWO_14165 [Paracoccaceae bacterium]
MTALRTLLAVALFVSATPVLAAPRPLAVGGPADCAVALADARAARAAASVVAATAAEIDALIAAAEVGCRSGDYASADAKLALARGMAADE